MFKSDQIIGRHYKIISKLGTGGMGQVYKGLDVNLGREVAIKFLLPEVAKEDELVQRFLNEGRILATIANRAVITVFASDVEETQHIPFLVMEYVDGKSIAHHKERLQKEIPALLNHFIQLLSGIHACHQKDIIHRDLKPDNVLINQEDQLKIVDFGIARTASRQTKTGVALGTPHYMSPEQCLGKNEITAKADIYSIGIMLYEFLSGKLPFDLEGHADDPALSIALMHLNQEPDFSPLSEIEQGKAFEKLLKRMMAKKPEDRPEIPEILETIKGILNSFKSDASTTETPSIAKNETDFFGGVYKIEEQIGSGGMGVVYKALDTTLNRTVAIKLLHENTAKDNQLVERFIQEGQTLATVGHRNVMGIYASSRDPKTGRPFLVMEFIEGKPLSEIKDIIQKEKEKSVPVMLQLAEGVAACHNKGIIHRDLKPSNILLTPTGLLKVLDFGIAKTTANLTKTGMTVGTPEYMSPEQCTGSKNISVKSDIYSLGIIFWELIFGSVPYKAETGTNPELSVALKHIEATLPAQVVIPDAELAPIISLVRRMLDKDPEKRPDTLEIIDILDEFIEEKLPNAETVNHTSRRSRSASYSSSLSGITQSNQIQSSGTNYKVAFFLMLFGIAIASGGYIYYKNRQAHKSLADRKAEFEFVLKQKNYSKASEIIKSIPQNPKGKDLQAELIDQLSELIMSEAATEAATNRTDAAIKLYAQAIAINPSNPKAALELSKLQQLQQKQNQLEEKANKYRKIISQQMPNLAPASGTKAVVEAISALNKLGFTQEANTNKESLINTFQTKGEDFQKTSPGKALSYFNEILNYYPENKKAKESAKIAQEQMVEDAKKLAQDTRVESLKTALKAAVEQFTGDQSPAFILQQIGKLETGNNKQIAQELTIKLSQKIIAHADLFIINDPQKAITLLEEAKKIDNSNQTIETKILLAQESLQALKNSQLKQKERNELADKVKSQISAIKPPAAIDGILKQLTKLHDYKNGDEIANDLKDSLFQKYFDSIEKMVKTDPNESLKSLEICMTLKPKTSGLNELKANIKKKIAADKTRSTEEKAKAKARELKKLRTKIYTQIKKNKMPEAIADIVKQISELKDQHPKSDASKKLEKHLKNRIYNEFDRKKRKNPEKALQIIETALKHYPNDQKAQKLQSDLQANMEKALANAKLEKQKAPHLKAIRSFIKKPTKNIAHAIKAHLHQLKQIDPKEDTEEHLSQIIKKLDQKAINSNTIDKASDYLEARQILQPAPNYNLNYELTSLTNKKVKHIIDFANNHKISKDIKPIKERLELLENWNANNKKEFFIHALIQNYKQNILKEAGNDKQKALEYLTALYEIPGLSSDNELMGLEKSLRAGTTQQPISPDPKPASPATNPLVTKLKQNADLIITRKVIFEQSGKLFSIIDNLNKLGKSNEAQSYKQKASESLLKTATRLINTKDLANAQKYIILAKQFSPESENAQKLQIKLTKAKNEAKKNQPLVVGPGGYSTIAQAIKAAPEGATITIKPGTYKESIKLTKKITLKGASPASCFVQSNKGPALVVSSNATVSGLTFSNKSPVQSSTIFIPKGSPKISYCEITNDTPAKQPQWSAAIEIGGGSPTINKCTIKEAKGMGIIITGGSPTIKNNTVRNCSIYGVWFNGSCSAKLLNNTVIGNLKSGVGVKNNANPTISGNQISNSGENGILIYSNGKGTYNNNKVSSNKLSGIDIWEAQPAAISGNSINNNKKDGIQVRGNKTVAKIGKNTIQGNRGKDIRKISGKIIPF